MLVTPITFPFLPLYDLRKLPDSLVLALNLLPDAGMGFILLDRWLLFDHHQLAELALLVSALTFEPSLKRSSSIRVSAAVNRNVCVRP
jgi:hypothetical protein